MFVNGSGSLFLILKTLPLIEPVWADSPIARLIKRRKRNEVGFIEKCLTKAHSLLDNNKPSDKRYCLSHAEKKTRKQSDYLAGTIHICTAIFLTMPGSMTKGCGLGV